MMTRKQQDKSGLNQEINYQSIYNIDKSTWKQFKMLCIEKDKKQGELFKDMVELYISINS